MKLPSIFLALLMLASVASSAPDYVVIGPYNVSFDLGNVSGYEIEVKDPTHSETLSGSEYTIYGGTIIGDDRTGRIGIGLTVIEEPDASPDSLKTLVQSFPDVIIDNAARREIDGSDGGIISAESRDLGKFYAAMYYPTFADDKMQCLIISTYQWDEGTLSLLRSLHVEEI